MKITKLCLRDFRGFESLDLDLAPGVTALVGVNGAGKTSILDAIAALASCVQEGVRSGKVEGFGLRQDDVRVSALSTSITLAAEIGGRAVEWTVATSLPACPPDLQAKSDVEALRVPAGEVQHAMAAGTPVLPLAVYFPTNRSVLDIPERIRKPQEFGSLDAYDGALEGGASDFRGFFEWFREEEDIYNEQVVSKVTPAPSPLPAVRSAIEQLVPGARGARIERRPQRMTVEVNGVRLDVAQLSDGERCLLAMAGDLARRMALAAPKANRPLEQAAVVLIDEVELHLHPGLQRELLPRLQRVFPNAQLIVSTHSPQVLSSLHASSVRVIERFALKKLDRGTWQRDTNRILEAAFGDPGRPPEVAEKLNDLRDAVDEDRVDDARRLIAELKTMIEGDDPDVFYYEQRLPPEGGVEASS